MNKTEIDGYDSSVCGECKKPRSQCTGHGERVMDRSRLIEIMDNKELCCIREFKDFVGENTPSGYEYDEEDITIEVEEYIRSSIPTSDVIKLLEGLRDSVLKKSYYGMIDGGHFVVVKDRHIYKEITRTINTIQKPEGIVP